MRFLKTLIKLQNVLVFALNVHQMWTPYNINSTILSQTCSGSHENIYLYTSLCQRRAK